MTDALRGTRNFTPGEYDRASTGGRVPELYRANAQRTLELLQRIRDALGVPVIITNGWRSPEHNAEIAGASATSQHMTADAADFDVPSMTKRAVAERLDNTQAAIAPYRQLIYYLTDNHFHVGTGTKGEQLVKVDATSYAPYTGADTLPADPVLPVLQLQLPALADLPALAESHPVALVAGVLVVILLVGVVTNA